MKINNFGDIFESITEYHHGLLKNANESILEKIKVVDLDARSNLHPSCKNHKNYFCEKSRNNPISKCEK